MAILFLFIHLPYPFEPIQLTLISVTTIGIPSFVLALEPNYERIKGRFFENILKNSVPTALTVIASILLLSLFAHFHIFSLEQVSSLSVLLTAFTGFLLLYKLCTPFDRMRKALWLGMIILFVTQLCFLKEFYSLTSFSLKMLGISGILMGIALFLYIMLERWISKKLIQSKILKKIMKTD